MELSYLHNVDIKSTIQYFFVEWCRIQIKVVQRHTDIFKNTLQINISKEKQVANTRKDLI